MWSVLGASGCGIFFYLEQRLLPVVATLADRIGLGGVAALAWEIGVVGGLVFLFTSVLGAPVVPAVALAIGVGVLYSLTMEYLVFGSGADHMANLLGLGRGWSGARGSDYSHAEALEIRGDIEGATEIYKEAIGMNRRDPPALPSARKYPDSCGPPRRGHRHPTQGLGCGAVQPPGRGPDRQRDP